MVRVSSAWTVEGRPGVGSMVSRTRATAVWSSGNRVHSSVERVTAGIAGIAASAVASARCASGSAPTWALANARAVASTRALVSMVTGR
jgi:hypothetical protein